MGAAKKLIDKKILRDLIPLNALSAVHLEEISRKAVIADIRAGRYIFKKGDRDYQSVYLLDGKIELLGDSHDVVSEIHASSEAARHPLAHKQPRQLSARAVSNVTIACIDSSLLDVLLTWDESSGYDVVEIDAQDDDDWMTRMLQSQAFLRLPPSNIHQLLMRLETIHTSAGEVIVRQGDDGDYFYIVKNGRLSVTRKASSRSNDVALAELGEGACFGEEALVSGTKRNASVTMLTDGCLMRLAQADFNELLRTPLVHEIDFSRAQKLVEEGGQWLDVRLPGELENESIKGAINLPLSALRDQAAELNDEVTYIVCCDTGRRSAAGAFVLSQSGFTVYTLKNGLMDVPDEMLTRADTLVSEPASVCEAEIIQFDAEAESQTSVASAASGAASRQVAEDQSDRVAELDDQLQQLRQQLMDAKAGLASADRSRADEHAVSEQLKSQTQSLEKELEQSRREREDLETKLAKRMEANPVPVDQHAGSLENQPQKSAKRISELEEEIERVRCDYHQLGQRTSALGGERDAVTKDLEKARKEIHALQEQLNSKRDEDAGSTSHLERKLEKAEGALDELSAQERSAKEQLHREQEQRKELERRCVELQDTCQEQDKRLQDFDQKNEQEQAEKEQLAAELDKRIRELEALGERFAQSELREQALHEQLQAAAQTTEETLLQFNADAAAAREVLSQRIEELLAEISRRDEQHADQESRRSDLERRLAQMEQELEALSVRERSAQEELQQSKNSIDGTEVDLQLARQQSDELRDRLAGLESELKISKEQSIELETKLKSLTTGYESDIASARGALTRAQDESDNVKREQMRLMEALRKAETNLASARNDHEIEIHRLRKELKESAGESNAGLAAELEAVQAQLKDGKRQREELEIQLGSRSEQLETIRAELERTTRRFDQAQESARQAEQQLVEANQATSEEMTVRLHAEQEMQDELRKEIDKLAADRDGQQQKILKLTQEADQLRSKLQSAVDGGTEKEALQQELVELGDDLHRAERDRDQALEERQELQNEVDQLRAEAEVTRGLVDMSPAGESDNALRDQIAESRRNVEVAVKLRSEAEARVKVLQQEVERMQVKLDELRSNKSTRSLADEIPHLDDDDVDASEFFDSVLAYDDDEEASDTDKSTRQEQIGAEPVSSFIDGIADDANAHSKPVWRYVLIGLVAVGLSVGAALWWLSSQSATDLAAIAIPGLPDNQPVAIDPALDTDMVDAAEVESRLMMKSSSSVDPAVPVQPESLPSTGEAAMDQAVDQTDPEDFPSGDLPDKQSSSGIKQEPSVLVQQPARVFKDTLRLGGWGPQMVGLYADKFEMGSGSISLNFDERPRHEVRLAGFAIGIQEVTFDQYERFAKATGLSIPADSGWGRGARPVINVSWQDAVAYTRWLSEQTGHTYRLPSEAEWEFVARAGSTSRYWWGSEVESGKANCFDCGSKQAGRTTARVGTFEANGYGVYDMAGNVREWVQDCYTQDYNSAPSDGSAAAAEGCAVRMVRGGGFGSPSDKLRSSSRDSSAAHSRFNDLGFRVVREF